ncbi:ATP-binding protein [Saccharothrix variisporea]|uniref:ATP-binding protein n=1 Tax=Saccharothrix variisporea TaxID=543527 RepID=UPI001476EC6E|nr:BTAD domain-containing putative transcriptional regulator [Saccharothrix variisporea]
MPGVEVRVLGPVDVRAQGVPITLDRPLERALVARLALARGAAVSDQRLAEDLWGDGELARPRERLRVLVSRLRASLGDAAGAVSRSAAGYALDAVPVDLVAVEEAAGRVRDAVRAGDVQRVRGAAAEALACWRDTALADVRSVPFAAAEGDRLDAVRLDLLVERVDAELALGLTADTATLAPLVAAHPLHERLAGLLAVAHYRAGRQADALAVLAALRRTLAEELGVDPAPDTAALELRLLRHDPALAPRPPTTRLPVPPTALFGRDGEVEALTERVNQARVVTLTGTAGSGKTRLALEVARRVSRPVVWLDLTPLRAVDELTPALLDAVGLEAGQGDPVPRIATALRGALLVVDNAEHVVDPAAALLGPLLRHGDGLSVLVTSQRPLLITGEEVHRVGPLPAPAAVGLFCARSDADPGPAVEAICAAVDRLPLGVALAAGLTRVLSVEQVAARLDDRLRLLVGGSRDAGVRHTSLRAALDWSHDLLDDSSRSVLRQLAVFVGGWTLEAAERVVSGEGVAAAVADLVDRSLVTVSAGPRFGMLETVRQYALDRLAASGEEEDVRARHLAWCAAHAAAHDVREETAQTVASLFAEWPNLLSALEHAPGTPRAADGLRLALSLDDAWMVRGQSAQVRRIYEALVDAPGVTDSERVRALSNYAFACAQSGRTLMASHLLDRAEKLAVEDDERMRVLYHRGVTEIERGRPAEALVPLRSGLAIADRLGRPVSSSAFLCSIGMALMWSGELTEALAAHTRANDIDRSLDDEHGLVRGLVNEATVLLASGRVAVALDRVAEAERLAVRLGDTVGLTHVGMIRGRAATDPHQAAGLFRAVLAQAEPGTDADLIRVDLATALLRSGDRAGAQSIVDDLVAGQTEEGLVWLVTRPVLAALTKDPELAAATVVEYTSRSFGWPPSVSLLRRLT